MKYSVLALLAGMAVMSPVRAQAADAAAVLPAPVAVAPATPAPGPRYITGNWAYPTSDQAADFFPEKALKERKSGNATIDCEVDHDGHVVECIVLAEDPKGYDFGYMAASLFISHARVNPASVEGGVRDGDRRKFTYQFTYRWDF